MLLLCFPPKKYAALAQNSEKHLNPANKIKATGLSNRDKYSPEKDAKRKQKKRST